MKIKVCDETLKATKCEKNLCCLCSEENIRNLCCKIEARISKKVSKIKCQKEDSCNYKVLNGSEYYCTCPVRNEIYDEHGL